LSHRINIEGEAFRLRPVAKADAAAIVELRTNPALTRFVHAISPCLEDQLTWLEQYFSRGGDYYFIVESLRGGYFEGTVAVYDVADGAGEWGRWVLRPGSLAAPESALLLYRVAFDILGLNEVYCRTVALNESVLSFHDRCGLNRRKLLPKAFHLSDGIVDAVEHHMTVQKWPEIQERLGPQAKRVAQFMLRKLIC
jgi:RimJ/RimL family protein N-acetyltransferase